MRTLLRAVVVILFGALVVAASELHRFASDRDAPEPVPPPDLTTALADLRPVHITLTRPDWTKVKDVVTADRLRTDHRLWQQMHFGDWDGVPEEFRTPSLRAMVQAYAPVLEGPFTWYRMTPADWDVVPQPIRAMAYLRMVWYWARVEQVGREFGYAPERLAQTIGAIVMAESWFEHRAINENQWGNRDLGLAQCSDHCRETLAEMAIHGEVGFALSDEEYFNPWLAARVATVWFERELHRAGGDLELAIRAYHRGIDNAMDEKGDVYLANVLRLRERYVRTEGPSPTWRFLAREIAGL